MKPSLFQLIFEWNALFFWSNFFWFLIHFILLIVISFKVSESESLKSQNQPSRKRRKPAKLNKEDFLFSLSSDDEDKGKNLPVSKQKNPAQNQPVRKRIKTDKVIEVASLASLISNDEDSKFAAESISKKCKEKKKG